MQHKYSQTFQFVHGKVLQRSQPKITISCNNFLNDSSYLKAEGIITNNNNMRSFYILPLFVIV